MGAFLFEGILLPTSVSSMTQKYKNLSIDLSQITDTEILNSKLTPNSLLLSQKHVVFAGVLTGFEANHNFAKTSFLTLVPLIGIISKLN